MLKVGCAPAAIGTSTLGDVPVARNAIAAVRLTPWLGTPIGMVTVPTIALVDIASRDRETRRLGGQPARSYKALNGLAARPAGNN